MNKLNIKGSNLKNFKKYGMILTLVAIIIFFQILTGGSLLKPLNIANIVQQNSYILILSTAMLLVIIRGTVDLSVGSICAFIGGVAAMLLVQKQLPLGPVILFLLLLGAVIGAWNGFWIAYVGVPPFIVTLASQLIFRGLAIIVLDGQTIGPFPNQLRAVSSSFLPGIWVNSIDLLSLFVGLALIAFILLSRVFARRKSKKYGIPVRKLWIEFVEALFIIIFIGFLIFSFATFQGIPSVLVLLGILIIIFSFLTTKTTVGRRIYAVGGNDKVAMLSGIDTKKYTFMIFVTMGFIASVAGLVYAGRLNAGSPKAGVGFELDSIAACYIGGASASGGIGTIAGTMIGGLIMGILNNGMSIIGVAVDWQQVIKGLVLLLAVAFDLMSNKKKQ